MDEDKHRIVTETIVSKRLASIKMVPKQKARKLDFIYQETWKGGKRRVLCILSHLEMQNRYIKKYPNAKHLGTRLPIIIKIKLNIHFVFDGMKMFIMN